MMQEQENKRKEENAENLKAAGQKNIREGQEDSSISNNNPNESSPYPAKTEKDLQEDNQEEFITRPHSVDKESEQ